MNRVSNRTPRFKRVLGALLVAASLLGTSACRGGLPDTPGTDVDAEIAELSAYLDKHPEDDEAWRRLAQLHWIYKSDSQSAEPILAGLASRDDALAHFELAWMAHTRFDDPQVHVHVGALLILASQGGPASLAGRLAESSMRLLDDVQGERGGDGPAFVSLFDSLDRTRLAPEVDDILLSMRARQARLDEEDASSYYAQQGCLQDWRVGAIEGHRGALGLADAKASAPIVGGKDPAVPLTCAVRIWNSTSHPGIRRLRTIVDSQTDTLLLSVAAEDEFRVYVDGEEVHRSDEFRIWPLGRGRIAVPVVPGRHAIEVHTVVVDERAWQIVRARDAAGRPLKSMAPTRDEQGEVAGLRGEPLAYGRTWEAAPKLIEVKARPMAVAQPFIDRTTPKALRGKLYAPLIALLALDDALADGDTDAAEQHSNRVNALAQGWAEGSLLRADFENIEPTRGRTNSAAREQAALESALAADSSLDRARLRLLALGLDRGDISEVVQELERLETSDPPRLAGVEGQMLRFETYRARRNELLADEALARASSLEPDNCEVLGAQRKVAVERNWEKEVDRLVVALGQCRGGSGLRARLAQQRGEFPKALSSYEERVERANDDLSARDTLAEIHVAQEDLDAAIARLETVVERAPWRGATRIRLADLLAQQGRVADARTQVELAIERSPHVTRLWEVAEHLGVQDSLLEWRIDGKAAIASYRAADQDVYEGAADVLVLDRDVVMVYPNGSQRHLIHQVTELRTKASLDQHGEVPSPSGARVLTLRTLKPDGRVVEPELIPGKEGLSLRELEVGDMFEIEYILGSGPEVSWPDYVDLSRFRFQSLQTPYHHSELIVVHPSDMPVRVESRNYPPKAHKTQEKGLTTLRFLARGMPRMPAELAMRSGLEELPMVRVFTQPTLEDWTGNLELQIRAAQRSNPELRAKTQRLTKGLQTDADKLDALRAWILDEVEETSAVAHPATATLADREGSALMLLRVMLREAGVASELWLVRDRLGAADKKDGHPLLEAYNTPMLAVFVDDAKEPIMIMMSAKTIPLRYLTPGYAGAPAYRLHLLDEEPPSGPVTTPEVPAGLQDARGYQLILSLDSAGDGVLEGSIELRGLEAILWRNELERLDEERLHEAFQGAELQRLFPYTALDLQALEVTGQDQLDAPLVFTFRAVGRGLAIEQGGRFVLPASPMPMNLATSFTSLPDRWSGLIIPYAPRHHVVLDVEMEGIRALQSAAGALTADETSKYGRYQRTVRVNAAGTSLKLTLDSQLNTGVVEADDYPELADFAKRVAGREEMVFKLE